MSSIAYLKIVTLLHPQALTALIRNVGLADRCLQLLRNTLHDRCRDRRAAFGPTSRQKITRILALRTPRFAISGAEVRAPVGGRGFIPGHVSGEGRISTEFLSALNKDLKMAAVMQDGDARKS